MAKKILFKRFFYSILFLSLLLIIAYFLQPLKKGTGLDKTISYELVKDWPKLPASIQLGNPTGIGMDTSQHIIVFHRGSRNWPLLGSMPKDKIGQKTVLIIDRITGELINSWGNDLFIMPHGLTVDHQNNIWVTDVGLHQVFKFDYNGQLLLTLGQAGVSGNDSLHFNKPTDVAVCSDGSFYVSDGYGNSRIVKFSATGQYLFQWGKKGKAAGEFNIPHSIDLDSNGNVYVADRENNRIQVFDSSGRFLKELSSNDLGNVCAVSLDKHSPKLYAVDDLSFLKVKHRGSDALIFDSLGQVQTRFGRSGQYTGATAWYHDLTVDQDGNIYFGDILHNTVQKFRKVTVPSPVD